MKKFAAVFSDIIIPVFIYSVIDYALYRLLCMIPDMDSSAAFGITSLCCAAALYFYGRKSGIIRMNFRKCGVMNYLVLLIFSISSAVCLNYTVGILGIAKMSEKYTTVSNTIYSSGLAAGILLYGIIAPAAEELLFRGILYNVFLKETQSAAVSCLIVSVMFGVFHGNIVQGLYSFLLGILLVYVYCCFGYMLLIPYIFHAAANICIFSLSFYPGVSGYVFSLRTVIILAAVMAFCMIYLKKYGRPNH